jgi:hypothetical protein
MIGGIDQQIQQKVDAYRGNPQQLMQRYQQNQELIDLLALQKLKSEKDAAAREMQMQMQTTPQTIRDQREAELLGRTKDEMVQQTGGIMQERAKRQQQNMQRTANQGLPQLPAGNMQQMAGGGIVSFAKGGLNDVDAQMRQLIEAALELGESPEALAERLKDNPRALEMLRGLSQKPSMEARPERAVTEQRPIMSPRLASEAGIMSGPLATPPAPKEGGGLSSLLGGSGAIDPVQRRKEREAALAPREQQAEGTMAQREQQRQETLESSPLGGQLFKDNRLDSQLQEIDPSTIPERLPTPVTQPTTQTATQTAPSQQQMDQLQEIDTSGLAGLKKESLSPRESYEANRSVLSKELLRQQSPEELQKERRRAFLYGGLRDGGRGGFGGRGAAMADVEAAQKARELQGIEKLMGVDKELMSMDTDQAKLEIERQTAEGLNDIRNMQAGTQRLSAIGSLYTDALSRLDDALDMDTAYQEAKADLAKAEKGGMFTSKDDVRKAKMKLDQERQRILKTMPNLAMLERLYNEIAAAQGGIESMGTNAGEIDTSQFQVRQKS